MIVDATFTPPTLIKSIDCGANIVIHSLSKWIGGHGTAIGGAVIDAGNFDWSDKKFALYNEPDPGYHGMRFARDLGELNNQAFILPLRTVGLRNLGPTLSPDSAWIFLQGLQSLPLRIRRHSEKALEVAKFLTAHKREDWVRYPGLPGDPSYPFAKKYLKNGFGGVVVFGVKGGYEAAIKVVDNISLFSNVANVGDSKSLIRCVRRAPLTGSFPPSTKQGGLTPELLRLSIGLENVEDIKETLGEVL